jgi:hypothetical protein
MTITVREMIEALTQLPPGRYTESVNYIRIINMNERIKELAEQATCDIKDEFGYWIGRELDKEKFADLILFECIKLAVFRGDAQTGKAIKEHFGVE